MATPDRSPCARPGDDPRNPRVLRQQWWSRRCDGLTLRCPHEPCPPPSDRGSRADRRREVKRSRCGSQRSLGGGVGVNADSMQLLPGDGHRQASPRRSAGGVPHHLLGVWEVNSGRRDVLSISGWRGRSSRAFTRAARSDRSSAVRGSTVRAVIRQSGHVPGTPRRGDSWRAERVSSTEKASTRRCNP